MGKKKVHTHTHTYTHSVPAGGEGRQLLNLVDLISHTHPVDTALAYL